MELGVWNLNSFRKRLERMEGYRKDVVKLLIFFFFAIIISEK